MTFDILTGPYFGYSPSKMDRGSEKTTRYWIYVVKGIIIIPAAIAGFAMKDHWRFVRDHPELGAPPYNEESELAFFLVYISVCNTQCFSCALSSRLGLAWLMLCSVSLFGPGALLVELSLPNGEVLGFFSMALSTSGSLSSWLLA